MELKQEIIHIISTLPEDSLPRVLEMVRKVKEESKSNKICLSIHLPTILETDANLLKRLAQ